MNRERKDLRQKQLDPFSRFDTIPACDRQKDRRTDMHDEHTALE